jgi:FMN reductase [NAD(P)H]
MDTYELAMKRRSVRNFSDRNIPEAIIEKLLDAAANAPSGGNIQPLSIIIVREAENRRKLAELVGDQPWVKNAPLSLVFCIDFNRLKRWASLNSAQFKGERSLSHFLIAYADIMSAAQTVSILAESFGLGSVYVGSIISSIDEARSFFAMPRCVLPLIVLSLGYPKSIPRTVPKLKRDFMVHEEKYRDEGDEEIKRGFDAKYGDFGGQSKTYFEKAYIEAIEAEKQGVKDWASSAAEEMKRLEISNNAQFLFKIRYPADVMVELNKRLLDSFENAGFAFWA